MDGRKRAKDSSLVYWKATAIGLPLFLVPVWRATSGGKVFVMVALVGITALATWRFLHHTGDRHRTLVENRPKRSLGEALAAPAPGAKNPAPLVEGTVLHRVGVSLLGPEVTAKAKTRQVMILLLVGLVMYVVMVWEQKSVAKARAMQHDIDRLLGIPGEWNDYRQLPPRDGIFMQHPVPAASRDFAEQLKRTPPGLPV